MKKWKYILGLLFIISLISGCAKNDMEEGSVENYYREAFNQYLITQLDLKEYDFMLEESEMNYIPNDEESKSEAQKTGDLGLKYLYLRNELHLERLDEKDIETLEAEMRKSNGAITEKTLEVIENTYAKVITPKEIVSEEDKKVLTYYDESMSPEFVTMDSLVLKIGTMGEFDAEGNYVDRMHEDEKAEQLQEYAANMEMVLEGKLGEIPIRVFVE